MDFLVGGVVFLILGSSFAYVRKQIRAGNRCMGCSQGKNCSKCPCEE